LARAKFLHTADLHLGRPFGFLPPQLAEDRRRDQRTALTHIADLAIEREVDFLLVAGDLFDSADPDPTDLEAVTKEFSRLASSGKRIFAIPGNHDFASPRSFWEHLNIPDFHVFPGTDWSTVTIDELGIAVAGIAFDRSRSDRRAFEGLEIPSDVPTVAMVHASYESFEGQLERYHPFSESELAEANADYVALGHYHRMSTMQSGKTLAAYPGTPEGISFDSPETDDRFVILGEFGDDGKVSIEPIKINKRVMRSMEIDCTSFDSQAGLFDVIRNSCNSNALVQLKLTGVPSSDLGADLPAMADRFKESCLYMTIDTSSIALPEDLPTNDPSIRGRFCRHIVKLIESTSDAERKRLLKRALELGMAAFSEK
jgi:DNA repair exonuclease SbcCD nuclease subunit